MYLYNTSVGYTYVCLSILLTFLVFNSQLNLLIKTIQVLKNLCSIEVIMMMIEMMSNK